MLDAFLRQISAVIRDVLHVRIDPEQIKALNAIRAAAENFDSFLTYLSKRGWGVPAHTIDATTFWQPLLDTNYNYELAEERVAAHYETLAPSLAEVIAEQPALEHLRAAIKDAGKAHVEGRYTLAIPIWLIAIDATATALGQQAAHPRVKYKAFQARSVEKYRRSFGDLFSGEPHSLRDLLATTLGYMSQPSKKAYDFAPTVNRNAALHGQRCYSERNDSLRVLTVLFALIDEATQDEAAAAKTVRAFT